MNETITFGIFRWGMKMRIIVPKNKAVNLEKKLEYDK